MEPYVASLKQHNLYLARPTLKRWGGCAYPQPTPPKKKKASVSDDETPGLSQRTYRMKKTKVKDKCQMLFNTKAGQKFIAFYSVSFPEGISDDDAFKVWNYWLTFLRKEQKLTSYLWVTERQKNGTIHYHMLTCDYMPIRKTNDALRTILKNYNEKYNRGWQNIENYNGVDVFSVWAKRGKNVKRGYNDYTIKDFISKEEFEQRKSRGISKRGDILFTTEAPLGNVAIADLEEFSAGQRLITFQQYDNSKYEFINKFYYYYMLSLPFQKKIVELATGATAQGIKAKLLKTVIVPIPTLSEQQSIVATLDSLKSKVDRLQANYDKISQECDALKQAILRQVFE